MYFPGENLGDVTHPALTTYLTQRGWVIDGYTVGRYDSQWFQWRHQDYPDVELWTVDGKAFADWRTRVHQVISELSQIEKRCGCQILAELITLSTTESK